MEPEILISVSFRLPQADRAALAQHLGPLISAAIQAGGDTVNINLQPYTPENNDD